MNHVYKLPDENPGNCATEGDTSFMSISWR